MARRMVWIPRLLAFAVGILASDALWHLLPHSVETMGMAPTFLVAAAGFGLFAVVGRFLRKGAKSQIAPMASVSLGSDAIHNISDGALIAAAFAVSPLLGVTTVIAILAHEIPQELGDFAVLLEAGLAPARAAAANLASALTVFAGALAGLTLGASAPGLLAGLAPFAAGGFLYLALFVLLPALARHPLSGARWWLERLLPMALGVVVMAVLAVAEERLGLDHGHIHGIDDRPQPRSFAPWHRQDG